MNLVGKILVVLNCVASLVFMTFAVVVHATHTNWKDEVTRAEPRPGTDGTMLPKGLRLQLQDKDTELAALQTERNALELSLTKERRLWEQRLGQLSTAVDGFRKQYEDSEKRLAEKVQEARDAIARMQAAEQRLTTNQQELERLRDEIRDARLQRDEHMKKVVVLEDELAQAKGEWQRLEKRNQQLLQQISELQIALQDHQIQLDPNSPPRVQGQVLASMESGYIEISIGRDDGLEKGHLLDVYREGPTPETTKYLGKIQIVRVEPDKAVARILPEYQKGKIQRGDRVATRLG
jgi:hypothetical protein